MNLMITYKDIDGNITERQISDITLSPYGGAVDAFCHIRRARRTFGLARVKSAINMETGEVYSDLSQCVESLKGVAYPIHSELISAIKALKYFCLQVRRKRGFAQKERAKILDFIRRNDRDGLIKENTEGWLCSLWVGDIFDDNDITYQNNLNDIPESLRAECRFAAIHIAAGSGRIVTSENVMNRINSEYPSDGSIGKQIPGFIM